MFRIVLILAGILVFAACKTVKNAQKSSLHDIIRNRNAKNIALVFGASNGLPGVSSDLINVEKMIKEDFNEQNFETIISLV